MVILWVGLPQRRMIRPLRFIIFNDIDDEIISEIAKKLDYTKCMHGYGNSWRCGHNKGRRERNIGMIHGRNFRCYTTFRNVSYAHRESQCEVKIGHWGATLRVTLRVSEEEMDLGIIMHNCIAMQNHQDRIPKHQIGRIEYRVND